jgi:hypothetical protein
MMIEYIPRSIGTDEDHESFVLSHPDLDSQNVLVSEDGTLTALLGWDNVHTVPDVYRYRLQQISCLNHKRLGPGHPASYSYDESTHQPENSPEELEFYRRRYPEKMGTLMSDALDFRTKSHLFEALRIAASSPLCTDGIVEKIFNHVFPEDGQEDLEEPIYLYETAVDLAKDTLGNAKELRIRKAFEGLFNP